MASRMPEQTARRTEAALHASAMHWKPTEQPRCRSADSIFGVIACMGAQQVELTVALSICRIDDVGDANCPRKHQKAVRDVSADLAAEVRRRRPECGATVRYLPDRRVPEGDRRVRPDGDAEVTSRTDGVERMNSGAVEKAPPQVEGRESGVIHNLDFRSVEMQAGSERQR